MNVFLPLHVFCGDKLLVSYLRPSNEDGAKHSAAILSLLVKEIRKKWADVKIIFRGDCGFCRLKILRFCEKNNVDYVVGIGGNKRIQKLFLPNLTKAKQDFDLSNKKQKTFADFIYKAKTWKTERKVVGKAEVNQYRDSTRFVITTLKEDPEVIYNKRYCPRGNMENKIQQQFLLFSLRTSCHLWWGNQLRLLLSGIAYILLEKLQSGYLENTKFCKSKVNTLRLRLLKISSVIITNTRKIMFYFSKNYIEQNLFVRLVDKLDTS